MKRGKDRKFQLYRALPAKYDSEFNIYRRKQINLILLNYSEAPSTIFFKDVSILSEKREYLRRYYSSKVLARESEISLKMRLILKSYGKKKEKDISYEYPTMFITHTYLIFINRILSIKKNRVVDISIDMSSERKHSRPNYYPALFPGERKNETKYYLQLTPDNSLINSSSSFFNDFFKKIQDQDDMSSSVLDIYAPQAEGSLTQPSKVDFRNLQRQVEELICDFGDKREEKKVKVIIIHTRDDGKMKKIDSCSIAENQDIVNELKYSSGFRRKNSDNTGPLSKMESDKRLKSDRGKLKSLAEHILDKKYCNAQTEPLPKKKSVKEKALQLLKKLETKDSINYEINL